MNADVLSAVSEPTAGRGRRFAGACGQLDLPGENNCPRAIPNLEGGYECVEPLVATYADAWSVWGHRAIRALTPADGHDVGSPSSVTRVLRC